MYAKVHDLIFNNLYFSDNNLGLSQILNWIGDILGNIIIADLLLTTNRKDVNTH